MVRKTLIVTVGYTQYMITEEDAIRLLGIASRCTPLKRGNSWSDPLVIDDEAEPFVKAAELLEVDLPDDAAAPQPSVYTAAARGLP